ncbi:hypothetical protein BOX15_Mlig027412g1 [Macrostomum lignano]|uniref:Fibronectin type-II domain-containing protein n=1 Tax=Macrostomum lignano TaxID=282301 RepID=A0A267DP44_9PLAT|nr:hypothetical protein BOX15_Mlig027412g3 [Macrostomum lignano]PAA52897.1 hypothetical protein BOX15_Mlig027412g2 [Macrostomum lignano]PAA73158.1 hypothetical protein BOX15_Mlig027412g1 [Macrostomum lignano]
MFRRRLSLLLQPMLPLLLQLLLPDIQPATACSATSVREIQSKIVNGKLAAIRCSDIKGILRGGSLMDPATYIECLPNSTEHACTGGARCLGYRCGCPDGLVYIGALGCTDVDECSLKLGGPACTGPQDRVSCVNLQGGFACNCTQPGQQYHPEWGCTDSPECVFPFVYRGKRYTHCTSADRGYLWCGLSDDVDRDNRWVACPLSYGTAHCVFPTRYQGELRSGCFVDKPTGKRLCSLTSNFDADREAELCMEVA